jgi:hypothetical protein
MRKAIVLALVVTAAAACASPPAPTPTASSRRNPPAPEATAAVSPQRLMPTPLPTVLLAVAGSESKSSTAFSASGDSVFLTYTFACSGLESSGKFEATFYDRNRVAMGVVHERTRSGGDTTTVYMANTAVPYHVEVNSDCAWAITVKGRP